MKLKNQTPNNRQMLEISKATVIVTVHVAAIFNVDSRLSHTFFPSHQSISSAIYDWYSRVFDQLCAAYFFLPLKFYSFLDRPISTIE